jgi:WD40 repeat protein
MNITKHWAAMLDDYVIDLAWSPDGSRLAAAAASGPVTLWDAAGAVIHKLAGHDDGTNAIAWRPAVAGAAHPGPTAILATGGQDGHVRFWNPASGQPIAQVPLGSAWVEHLAWASVAGALPPVSGPQLLFAAAGRRLVALRSDGTITHPFKDAPKSISALAWRPGAGGATKAAAGAAGLAVAYFGGVCLWDAGTFAAQKEFAYGNAIHALVCSPDARWLVAGTQDNAVHLWIPAEDVELHMSGYETKVKELSFSHDSRWLATGGGRDVCVWDCAGAGPEGREPLLLPQAARTSAVAFQHHHGLLATAAVDGVFSLWAPTRQQPLVAEIRLPAPATKVAWSGDDSLLAISTEQGAVYAFKVEP